MFAPSLGLTPPGQARNFAPGEIFATKNFDQTASEKWEKECERTRKENEVLLNKFGSWLEASGLSARTIDNHLANVDFYINHFLLYYDVTEPADGVSKIGAFLGDWYIRKAMWANKSSIRGNAASLKKFYSFLCEKGLIDEEELADLKRTIKEELPCWLETLQAYDDAAREVW